MGYGILNPEKVRAKAEEKGLDRRALAEAAGISMSTLRRIERGERVTFRTGWKVARPLEVRAPEIAMSHRSARRAR